MPLLKHPVTAEGRPPLVSTNCHSPHKHLLLELYTLTAIPLQIIILVLPTKNLAIFTSAKHMGDMATTYVFLNSFILQTLSCRLQLNIAYTYFNIALNAL